MPKRIAAASIKWSVLYKACPPHQKKQLDILRTKYDIVMKNCFRLPAAAPKIYWAHFKRAILVPGMVDAFQKEYESMQIPYPTENVFSQIDEYEQSVKKHIEDFKKTSNQHINKYKKEINYIDSLIPYDQMTMEDYYDSFPQDAVKSYKPTFWPHLPEDQIGWKPPPEIKYTDQQIREMEELEKMKQDYLAEKKKKETKTDKKK